jgi:hypothetical protein
MNEVETYESGINIVELQKRWPDQHELPQLIIDMSNMIKLWEWGSVGYFTMPGSRMNDYWTEYGADLWDQFGLFLRLPDGTELGIWFHDQVVPGAEPVVQIGSEGDLSIVAPNLKTFFMDWAKGNGIRDLGMCEEDELPEYVAKRKALYQEMLSFLATVPEHPPGAIAPDLEQFMADYGTNTRAQIAADPTMQAITKLMDNHIPHGQESWTRIDFSISIVGDHIEILSPLTEASEYTERVPLPELPALIPLVLQARLDRVQGKHQVRGLWHCANLRLHGDGTVYLAAGWDEKPDFRNGDATKAELQQDLDKFPLGDRWREQWMDELQ